jgi:hypothetical protein
MTYAPNPREIIGGNGGPPLDDDVLPPKSERIVNRERAEQLLLCAKLISTLFKTPKYLIMEKRKGGEEGRALRRFLIFYARGLGSPVWESAKIFDLDRKQIGQEEASYLDMLASNPDLEEDVESMIDMLDSALKVNRGRFIRISLTEIQADAASRRAIKEARKAADLLEAAEPPPKPVKKKLTEAERLVAEGQQKRRAAALGTEIEIARSVIDKAKGPNATKEQKKDAVRETEKLKRLLAQIDPR